MSRRHHIHVCYASGDLICERSLLMQRFANTCFFTWSLEDTNTTTVGYSRQQIDICDYVFFLIGGKYGTLSASGPSFLHLDFIYASTKKKPMLVMLHTNPKLDFGEDDQAKASYNKRKLEDFRNQVLRDSKKMQHFSSGLEFSNKVLQGYEQLCAAHPAAGWIPAKSHSSNSNYGFINANDMMAPNDEVDYGFDVQHTKVNLNDLCHFSYRIQAFEAGNFSDMVLERTMAWGDILNTIAGHLKMPVLEDVFAKSLHEYLDKTALADAKKTKPNVHATARSQITPLDLSKMKQQFLINDWLKTMQRTNSNKPQLMLTPQGARQAAQWQSMIARRKI